MENSVLLDASGVSDLIPEADFHDILDIGGRFTVYGREAGIEVGDIMGSEVNNLTIRGGLEIIFEVISGVHNTDSKGVGGQNGNKQTEW